MTNTEYRDIRPIDIDTHNGLRVTTPLRTVVDSSRWCQPATIGEQLTAATNRKLFTYAEIATRLAEISRPGKRGLHRLRSVLAARSTDERPLNSYEMSAKRIFRRAGFLPPVPQMQISSGSRIYFVDFAWPDQRLVVECDSMLAHSSPEQLQNDLDRQNEIIALGWTILRFTYWDVVDRPGKVIAALQRHFARR